MIGYAFSTRIYAKYAGEYENTGGGGGIASGTFTHCTGGSYSYTAGGTFLYCIKNVSAYP